MSTDLEVLNVQKALQDLGIEFHPKSKYSTACPKCSKKRKKSNTRSLQVYIESSTVKFRCFHGDMCDYNSLQSIAIEGEIEGIEEVSFKAAPIPSDAIMPIPNGAQIWKYCTRDGTTWFYIWRTTVGNTNQKIYYPIYFDEELGFVMKDLKVKTLYRAEKLSSDNRMVIVVEGEKAADAAAQIFTQADVVTWVGGSKRVSEGDWSLLNNRKVLLWPDNDEAGRKAMNDIANLIDSPEIYLVDTRSAPEKGDLADNLSKEIIEKIFATRINIAKPIIDGSLSLSKFLEKIKDIKTGLSLGFPTADKTLRLPQSGLTVIEGRSGHGKTSLMLNLAVNMLNNTERPVLYFSYEIPSSRMLLKLLMILEGKELDTVAHKNEEMYRKLLLENNLDTLPLLDQWLNKRLFITDTDLNIKQLVQSLDNDRFNNAIVFVDYIQLIPTSSGDSRYLVIKQFADSLRSIGNKRNQVIITGSQLTDGETPYQDMAREGKDITNASELVMKIWNKTVAEVSDVVIKKNSKTDNESKQHYYDKAEGNFVISIKKNRNGEVGKQYGFNLMFGTKLVEAETIYTDF